MLSMVQIQLLDEKTGTLIEDVIPLTHARAVFFPDGDSFLDKFNKGELKGKDGKDGKDGAQGPKGDQGSPFKIKATYPSIKDMNLDINNLSDYDFVMIDTDDVKNIDNAKLFMKVSNEFKYITDLSGAQGIQGPKGDRGPQGIKGDKGDTGDTGPQGIQGKQGEPGPQGLRGERGERGPRGEKGFQGEPGKDGKDGDKVKYGVTTNNSTEVGLFFKKID